MKKLLTMPEIDRPGQILDPPAVGRIREDIIASIAIRTQAPAKLVREDHAPPPGCTIYGCGQMADDGIGSDGTLVRRARAS